MSGSQRISRRRFLGGAGALLALPVMEGLLPRTGHAGPAPNSIRRILAFYTPCGIHMLNWTPTIVGTGYDLPPILQPLAPVQDSVLVLTGLANLPARPDGPGDHAGGTSAFLTCTHVVKTDGADILDAISMDQVAANAIGQNTRYPSLQLGIEGGGSAGGCDSGYSCAYTRNISWAGPKTPLQKTISPQVAFDLLFKGYDDMATQQQQARRQLYKTSILDYVLKDAQRLTGKLGKTDQQKMSEYMTGVRELELRLQNTTALSCSPGDRPQDNPDYPTQVRLMCDIMVLAFQCDLTRVITFMLNNAGTGRSYDFIGVPEGHHQLSHHMGLQVNFDKLTIIDTWEVAQYAYLLQKMKSIPEGDGTMLDHSAVFFSSEIEDGNAHRHTNLPVLLAGNCGGAFTTGRHVKYQNNVPIANLFISMLGAVGVKVSSFGDGTGSLDQLS